MSTSYYPHISLSPDRLPSNPNPTRRAKPGKKLGQIAGVFRLARETPYRMDLAGATALALHLLPGKIAAAQFNLCRSFAKPLKVDLQCSPAIKRAQRADAVAKPSEDDGKLRPFRQAAG